MTRSRPAGTNRGSTGRKKPGSADHKRNRNGVRYLFDHWGEVRVELRAAHHWGLFLDCDGTLVPLRPRPEMASLAQPQRRILGRLTRCRRVTVCIVSGRHLHDLQRVVRVRGVRYAGLYGWERNGVRRPQGIRRASLIRAKNLLGKRLVRFPGVWIEDKGMTLGVHYRGVTPSTARRSWTVVRRALKDFQPALRILPGKKVWEVLPAEIEGKGRGVRAMLAELPSGTLPIYVGDDAADEPAFVVLRRGITVRVGRSRNTRAHYFVHSPDEVFRFLEALGREMP